MKPLKYYILLGVVIFVIAIVIIEMHNFFFGVTTKSLGGSYGPQTVEEIIRHHLLKDSVALWISLCIGLFVLYKNDEYQFKKKQQDNKKPNLNDPILNKIIEDAKSGKTADDILKTQNEDSKIENEENDDHK